MNTEQAPPEPWTSDSFPNPGALLRDYRVLTPEAYRHACHCVNERAGLTAENDRLREQVAQMTEALSMAWERAATHTLPSFEETNTMRSALSAVERGIKP